MEKGTTEQQQTQPTTTETELNNVVLVCVCLCICLCREQGEFSLLGLVWCCWNNAGRLEELHAIE